MLFGNVQAFAAGLKPLKTFVASIAGVDLHPEIESLPDTWYPGYAVQHNLTWPPKDLLEEWQPGADGEPATSNPSDTPPESSDGGNSSISAVGGGGRNDSRASGSDESNGSRRRLSGASVPLASGSQDRRRLQADMEISDLSHIDDDAISGGGRRLTADPAFTEDSISGTAPDGSAPLTSSPALRRIHSSFSNSEPSVQQLDYPDALPWEIEKLNAEQQRLMALSKGLRGAADPSSNPILLQHLFSVYVHTSVEYELPRRSIFHDFQVKDRVNTSRGYAQHALVQVGGCREDFACAL